MKILYIGDIMGSPGRKVVKEVLPRLRRRQKIDLVIAQAENVSHGKSMSPWHMHELQQAGVDFFTGGNHSVERNDLHDYLANPSQPVICPANLKDFPTEWGVKEYETLQGKVLIASLLGQTFPKTPLIHNPLRTLDTILEKFPPEDYAAVVVNFHGDFSSEKRVIGYYSDGRITAMIGDHWHVSTADAMILPKGTAHITDVGMCGTLHSSLGIELKQIITRWHNEVVTPNRIEKAPPFQFNAVLFTTGAHSFTAKNIKQINKVIEKI